jgi:hypothetical protein
MSQEFKYKPLIEPDAIRLIELQPSSDPLAEVRCSLIYTALSSKDIRDIFSHYTALSYVWGSDEKVRTIWVDELPLKITANLFSALRDLRDETRLFLLWADGICINQSDNEEKGIQIQKMGQIYSDASNTILYLGPADPDSNECRCLTVIRQGHDATNADMWSSIFSRRWFTRVWVFQELVFSVNPWLQCGKTRVKWSSAYSALGGDPRSQLQSPQEQKHKIFSDMQRAWESYRDSKERSSMVELLRARRGLGVSDSRDMVFAHVGFAADGQHEDLKVDYSKTPMQVYADFARYIANKNGIAELLELVGDSKSPVRLKNLLSWSPDWTSPLPTGRLPLQDNSTLFNRALVVWVPDQPILALALRNPDTVLFTSSELSVRQIPKGVYQGIAVKLAKVRISRDESSFRESEHWLETREDIGVLKEIWLQVYQIWRKVVSDDNILPPQLPKLELEFKKGADKRRVSVSFCVPLYLILAFKPGFDTKYLNGRALARMSSGQLALVPLSTQKGDITAALRVDIVGLRQFVFRLFQSVDNRLDLDAKI